MKFLQPAYDCLLSSPGAILSCLIEDHHYFISMSSHDTEFSIKMDKQVRASFKSISFLYEIENKNTTYVQMQFHFYSFFKNDKKIKIRYFFRYEMNAWLF